MKNKAAPILLGILLIAGSAQGQNYILDFKAEKRDDGLQIRITAMMPFEYEVLRFDERQYTLIRFHPLRFEQDRKAELLASLKTLNFEVKALELLDNTVMLTLKDVPYDNVSIQKDDETKNVHVSVKRSINLTGNLQRNEGAIPQYYQRAEELYKRNQLHEAISAIRKAIGYGQNVPESYFLAGKIRFDLEEMSSAKINFRKSLELGLMNPETEIYLTRIDSIMSNSSKFPIKENNQDATPLITGTEPATANDNDTSTVQIATNLPDSTTESTENVPTDHDTLSVLAAQASPTKMSVPRPITKSYFQFGFFSLLVSLFIGWIMLVWKRRRGIVSPPTNTPAPDFAQVLEKTQSQKTSSSEAVDKNQDDPVNLRQNAPKKVKRTIRKPAQEAREEAFREPLQPPPFEGDPQDKVFRFASSGYSIEEIARRLGIGKGEVELMLNLNGRRSPMMTPEFRFELEESLY